MSLSPEIRDQAYQFFVEEAQELLQTIETGLLDLRHDRSTAKIHGIMRAAHSLKGGAASVELESIKAISHRLETIFKALYDESVVLDATLEAALLQGYDCLRIPLETQMHTGILDDAEALNQAEPILSHIETLLGDSLQSADNYIPSSEDLGVDIVASIFEVDVTQGLERLGMVLENPGLYPVGGELRAQLEVFMGLSEILELPGFGELTRTSIQALDRHPDRELEVLALALEDFQQACHQVLQGDRQRGGSPSAALVALAQETDRSSGDGLSSLEESQDLFGEIPSLENVFGVLGADLEEIPSEVNNLPGDSLTDSLNLGDIPSLEDVFGTDAGLAAMGVDSPSNPDYLQPLQPVSSDNISDNVSDNISDKIAVTANGLGTDELGEVPSLVDIFGEAGFEDDQGRKNQGLEDQGFENQGETDRRTVEETIAYIQTNFDQLPTLTSPGHSSRIDPNRESSLMLLSPDSLSAGNLSAGNLSPNNSPATSTLAPISTTESRLTRAPGRSLRVDFQRLERMNNLVGELVINRNSLALQNEQLQGAVVELDDRFDRFQTLVGQLRLIADRLLVESAPRFVSSQPSEPSITPTTPTQAIVPLSFDFGEVPEFDQLEMDRYTTLHSQLQEIFEEVLQLEESISDVNLFASQSSRSLLQQQQELNALQNELMWSRMLPLGEVFNRFPRILRDLCHRFQKPVNLKLTGTAVLVDKSILEKLYDPLLHLVRNAFDHGIEPLDQRQQHGKPPEATIEIRAYHRGNCTLIEVQDDGRGIDLEKIRQRALDLGWVTPETLPTVKPEQLYGFLFDSGFSTASKVTELSGRGVGLDIVKSQLEALKGSVSITSKPQQGTTFTLRLPLTLTLTKLLIVQAGQQILALPSDNLDAIVIPQPHHLKSMGTNAFVHWRGSLIPHYPLQSLLQYTCSLPEQVNLPRLNAVQTPSHWLPPLLIIRRGAHSFALEVDRLLTEQELVIKPFGPAISPPSYLYGCTVLGDGRLVPVMDAVVLLDYCLNRLSVEPLSPASLPADPVPTLAVSAVPTILVVDDSAALRRTLALTLQKGGYRVLQARDGLEALEQLKQHPGTNLVICDVEMPNMNGFEFLGQRRRDPQMANIPVFMLTSRSNDKHRQLARTLGAKLYFTKPYLEHELLTALQTELQTTPQSNGS